MRRAIAMLGVITISACHSYTPVRRAAEELSEDGPVTHFTPKVEACADAKDPLHPMIVEWPATSRTELETTAAKGPVVVSYAGCVLKVLSSCRVSGGGPYEVETKTPVENQIDIANEHDLRKELPLGVGSLRRELADGSRLALSYVTVGSRVLKQAPTMLEGDCAGATHYVASMDLGAFRLFAKHATSADASAKMGSARATVHADQDKEIDGSAGDLGACQAHGLAQGAPCQAVLELGLCVLPIVAGKLVTAGFGADLPAPRTVAKVPPLEFGRELLGKDLALVDVSLLELVQAAREVDGRDASSLAKADAWDRVAHAAPELKVAAARAAGRAFAWRQHAAAEEARSQQLAAMCPRFRADHQKLARLTQLEVVSEDDKKAYQDEFDKAYAPWPEIEDCAVIQDAVVERSTWAALHGANDGMVPVHAGTFAMGSSLDADSAMPIHQVTLADFKIDATEITVAEYAQCERAGACSHRVSHYGDDAWRCNDAGSEKKDRSAANCMTFGQATAYCHWAKKRLPTEEEWEYAARGPEARRYPWGDWSLKKNSHDVPFYYCSNPGSDLGYIAGSLTTNTSPFGARDMAGGVWEWTNSHFSKRYDVAPTGQERVLRGGEFGWSDEPTCKPFDAAYRLKLLPNYSDSNTGGRCVR